MAVVSGQLAGTWLRVTLYKLSPVGFWEGAGLRFCDQDQEPTISLVAQQQPLCAAVSGQNQQERQASESRWGRAQQPRYTIGSVVLLD